MAGIWFRDLLVDNGFLPFHMGFQNIIDTNIHNVCFLLSEEFVGDQSDELQVFDISDEIPKMVVEQFDSFRNGDFSEHHSLFHARIRSCTKEITGK